MVLPSWAGNQLLNEDPFTIYVCGITPYDATHLGHAATYLLFDLISRYQIALGNTVHFAENITDIDDPLLERALRDNQNWEELAQSQIDLFRSDMSALHIIPPESFVPVTTNIDEIADYVKKLIDLGKTYTLEGDIYFRITPYLEKLPYSYQDALEIFAQRGGDPKRAGKEEPLDALLWKARRPNEPYWHTVLGEGRPGWHIECSVIALQSLGIYGSGRNASISLQGGGRDLIFPHHFMSAAQVSALTGKDFASHFINAGMIGLNGEKMSKSLGNLILVSKLLAEQIDPMVIRWALMNGDLLMDRMWQESDIDIAQLAISKLKNALSKELTVPTKGLFEQINQYLADGLQTKAALQVLDDWATRTLALPAGDLVKGEAGTLARYIELLLGLTL
jgi:L-cysteine:1D-myo-inositol 2-amino-2-deoxy-alpha-D-glucopyranoside ligase